jgi:putative ABC transport system substrate-binding protein
MPKRLELLRELVPYLKQVAVLGVSESLEWKEVKSACDKNGIGLITLDIRRYKDLLEAFNIAATGKASGLIVLPSPRTNSRAGEIVELANRAKLPAIYPTEFYTSRGGLMSYGPSLPEMARRAAEYVDQILKGAKPGDLPIQQPKTFELIINAKTAKSLGLVIPSSLQLQAHSVIE